MFGIKKKMKMNHDLFGFYIRELQWSGLLKKGTVSILQITTGYELSRTNDTKCDVVEFRCGKGSDIYCMIVEYLDTGNKEIRLLRHVHTAQRLGGGRFYYLDEYLKSYEDVGGLQVDTRQNKIE